MEKTMSYLKQLVTNVCEDFDSGLQYGELAAKYELPLKEIQEIVDFYYFEVQE
jgi:uncharacterized protein (DUF433 family)